GAGGDDRPRTGVGEQRDGLGHGLLRGDGLAAYAGPALGEVAQAYVDPPQGRLVVEESVVEGHVALASRRGIGIMPGDEPRRRGGRGCRRGPGRPGRIRRTPAPGPPRRRRATVGTPGTRS